MTVFCKTRRHCFIKSDTENYFWDRYCVLKHNGSTFDNFLAAFRVPEMSTLRPKPFLFLIIFLLEIANKLVVLQKNIDIICAWSITFKLALHLLNAHLFLLCNTWKTIEKMHWDEIFRSKLLQKLRFIIRKTVFQWHTKYHTLLILYLEFTNVIWYGEYQTLL